MRIGVVGSGGIGGLYGGVLARAGHDVAFLARGEHLRAIRANGLTVCSPDFGTFTVNGTASDSAADLGEADLVLFAVKTYDLDSAGLAARQMLSPRGQLLTFQNGVDAPDALAGVVGETRVLIGTTRVQAAILEPGVVGHMSPGHAITVSALLGPPTAEVERTTEVLKTAGLNASIVDDGHQALWVKATMLVPMATISSVCRAALGPVRELPETMALFERLLDEFVAVADACGYDMAEARERALQTLHSVPPTWRTSMERDFDRGKSSELESLTGAVIRMADARGVAVPATRTAYAILKLREQQEFENAPAPERVGTGAAGG